MEIQGTARMQVFKLVIMAIFIVLVVVVIIIFYYSTSSDRSQRSISSLQRRAALLLPLCVNSCALRQARSSSRQRCWRSASAGVQGGCRSLGKRSGLQPAEERP